MIRSDQKLIKPIEKNYRSLLKVTNQALKKKGKVTLCSWFNSFQCVNEADSLKVIFLIKINLTVKIYDAFKFIMEKNIHKVKNI